MGERSFRSSGNKGGSVTALAQIVADKLQFEIMAKPSVRYQETLQEALTDPQEAAAYLNAALEEQGTHAEEIFLLALRDVATARGMQVLAEKSTLNRESLYRALSATGNPRLSTLGSILKALGLRLSVDVAAASDISSRDSGFSPSCHSEAESRRISPPGKDNLEHGVRRLRSRTLLDFLD